MVVHPSDLIVKAASGTGNMGDVTDVDSPCRFTMDADRWCLRWIRAGFVGGTTQADLTLCVDNHRMPPDWRDTADALMASAYDFTLYTIEDAGVDGWFGMWRADDTEMADYTFMRGDILVPTWTNPNTQEWALEVAMIDAALIGR